MTHSEDGVVKRHDLSCCPFFTTVNKETCICVLNIVLSADNGKMSINEAPKIVTFRVDDKPFNWTPANICLPGEMTGDTEWFGQDL